MSLKVHDLMPPLIKNLEAGPVLHLYDLVKKLPVREHTEQTIYLAQVLQKFIWTSGGTFSHLLQDVETMEACQPGVGRGKRGAMMGMGGIEAKKKKKKSGGNSSDDEDDVSDDVLAELADMDDDNDDIEEFSDVDDDDEDDDDIGTSDSDCDLRKSIHDTKPKLSKSPGPSNVKKSKVTNSGKKKKDSGVKRSHDVKISETEPEIELAVGGNKKPRVEPDVKVTSLPTPVPCSSKTRGARGGSGNVWAGHGRWARDSGQGAVMTELANLVGAAGAHHDMFPGHFRSFRPDTSHGHVYRGQDLFDPSGDVSEDDREAASPSPASSHASNKSDKNLADFADEESTDEEMVRLAQAEQLGSMLHQHQHLASMAQFYQSRLASVQSPLARRQNQRMEAAAGASHKLMNHYTMDKVAEPGNTILWDLIQVCNNLLYQISQFINF